MVGEIDRRNLHLDVVVGEAGVKRHPDVAVRGIGRRHRLDVVAGEGTDRRHHLDVLLREIVQIHHRGGGPVTVEAEVRLLRDVLKVEGMGTEIDYGRVGKDTEDRAQIWTAQE
jgi:hypothetical protein